LRLLTANRRQQKPERDEAHALLQRTRAILEGIADGVYVTDPSGKIRLWNRAAERIVGVSSPRARGRSCPAVLGLRIDDAPLECSGGCALLAKFGARRAAEGVEACRFRRDLRKQPLLVTVSAIKGQGGDNAEFVHTVRDITAAKQAEEAKTMFLATASHELKTPLTVILGFTEMARANLLGPEQLEQALGSIEHRARQLSRIVDRLLLTGRIDAGRLRLELKAVDLAAILTERAETLAAATGRTLTTDIPPGLPHVIGDEDALATVFDHLLDNAIKYSPGGGDIRLEARTAGPGVEVLVSDSGIGMDEEQTAHCFDRFWQAESTDVRRFGGTGIGLYIVRSLVSAMGGRVSAQSGLGKGSAFTVALQRARPGAADPEAAERESGEQGRRSMIGEFMRQIGVPKGEKR
jgi:PAS domain S-box-containing protein